MGIGGAANLISKLMSKVMFQTPAPIIIEYMQANIKRETITKVMAKLKNLLKKLDK